MNEFPFSRQTGSQFHAHEGEEQNLSIEASCLLSLANHPRHRKEHNPVVLRSTPLLMPQPSFALPPGAASLLLPTTQQQHCFQEVDTLSRTDAVLNNARRLELTNRLPLLATTTTGSTTRNQMVQQSIVNYGFSPSLGALAAPSSLWPEFGSLGSDIRFNQAQQQVASLLPLIALTAQRQQPSTLHTRPDGRYANIPGSRPGYYANIPGSHSASNLLMVSTTPLPKAAYSSLYYAESIRHQRMFSEEVGVSNPLLKKMPLFLKAEREIFPKLLHRALMQLDLVDGGTVIAAFMPDGKSFQIRNQFLFEQRVLPAFFPRMKGFASFQRQLNLYDFKRIGGAGIDRGAYHHECFLREDPELASQMKRTKIKGTGHSRAVRVVRELKSLENVAVQE